MINSTDLRRFSAKYFGYKIQDFAKGTEILKTCSLLKESQYWEHDKLYTYQLNKIKYLIDYSIKYVPYYSKIFKELGLTSQDINSLKDVGKIPILTKEIIRKEGKSLYSTQKFKNIKIGKTGGTTGSPCIVIKDEKNRSFTWGSYYRWYNWMGLDYYDSIVTFWGAPTVLTSSVYRRAMDSGVNFIQNETLFNSFNMSEKDMLRMYKIIIKVKPKLIKGYASSMIKFAKFLNTRKLSISGVLAISTTTETLLPHNRELLQKCFNAPVYDQYGCGEVSAIAYECSKHNGMHVNQEHVICEVLDKNDNPIMNCSGNIIATDLDNLAMPFIRFQTGDMGALSTIRCQCGVNQPLLSSIEGRSIETVVLSDGNSVHGVFFTDILYEVGILVNHVSRFQIIQNFPGEIEFYIECSEPLGDTFTHLLKEALLRYLSKVDIIESVFLESESNGKFRYIVNNLENV
jgi:phenylacetate-CoA ligase